MKTFITISRLIVGSLFIVSGLIKCNDAIGFSYKLNDYFAPDVLGMEFLIPYSLWLAVIICVVEIVLGVAVIFGLKSKLATTLILLMMLFFTWLTWYTSSCLDAQELASKLGEEFTKNCVTDCGCFGDALKLEPRESFYKDLFLLIFTIPLFIFGLKGKIPKNTTKEDVFYIIASLVLIVAFGVGVIGWWFTLIFSIVLYAIIYLVKNNVKNEWFALLIAYIIPLAFTWYCLQNLPIKDFRAYKVGSNIAESMVAPDNAPKAVIDYHWKFKVNGEEQIITTRGDYPSIEGEFIGVETEEIEPGYEIPIQDFSIERGDQDFTAQMLNEDHLLILVMYNLSKSENDGLQNIKAITHNAIKKGYKVIGLTASGEALQKELKNSKGLNFDFYFCDEKALKTVIRSNPGILKLEKGTIIQKLHWNNADEIELPEVKVSKQESQVSDSEKKHISFVDESMYDTDYEKNLYRASEYYLNKIKIPDSILLNIVPETQKDFNTYYGTTYPDHKLVKTNFFYETSDLIFDQVIKKNNDNFYLPSLKLASFADGEFAEGFLDKLEVIINNDTEKFCTLAKEKEYSKANPINYYIQLHNCN